MNWTLVTPEPTPSLNKTLRDHWAARKREKLTWGWTLKSESNRTRCPKATGKRLVTITRFGARRLDQDNLVGGCKSLVIDNLVQLGLLVDDTPDLVEVIYQQVPGKRRGTEITLQEAS